MDSEPRLSDIVEPSTQGSTLRALPRVATMPEAWYHPGAMAGLSLGFASRIGLSQVSRWALEFAAPGVDAEQAVRPPIDYWPWTSATSADDAAGLGANGHSVRRSTDVAGQAGAASRPIAHRGLPRTLARRSGVDGPGSFAAKLRPELFDPNELNDPRAASQRSAKQPSSGIMAFKRMLEQTGRIEPSEPDDAGDEPAPTGRTTASHTQSRDSQPGRRGVDRGPGSTAPDTDGSPIARRGLPNEAIARRAEAVWPASTQHTATPVSDDRGTPAVRRPRRERSSAGLLDSVSSPVWSPGSPAPGVSAPGVSAPGVSTHNSSPTSPHASSATAPAPRAPQHPASMAQLSSHQSPATTAPSPSPLSPSPHSPSSHTPSSPVSPSDPTGTVRSPTATATSSRPVGPDDVRRADAASPSMKPSPAGLAVAPGNPPGAANLLGRRQEAAAGLVTAQSSSATVPSENGAVAAIAEAGRPTDGPAGRPTDGPATRPTATPRDEPVVRPPADALATRAPSTTGDATAAEAFTAVLRSSPSIAPRPLPQPLRPLAAAIVGHTAVSMRTDHVARRALAAAGKRAATTGSVIHLPRTPDPRADRALLAHELTHVAHPSALPRFFDDDRPSVEERRADDIARLVQRSPILTKPADSAIGRLHDERSGDHPISTDRPGPRPAARVRATGTNTPASVTAQRSDRSAPSAGGVTVTAEDLVRRLTTLAPEVDTTPSSEDLRSPRTAPRTAAVHRTSPPIAARHTPARRPLPVVAPAAVIRRSPAPSLGDVRSSVSEPRASSSTSPSTSPSSTRSTPSRSGIVQRSTLPGVLGTSATHPIVQRLVPGNDPERFEGQRADVASDPFTENIADLRSASGTVDFVDWIMDQIEDRLLSELQRRGGRFRGDF